MSLKARLGGRGNRKIPFTLFNDDVPVSLGSSDTFSFPDICVEEKPTFTAIDYGPCWIDGNTMHLSFGFLNAAQINESNNAVLGRIDHRLAPANGLSAVEMFFDSAGKGSILYLNGMSEFDEDADDPYADVGVITFVCPSNFDAGNAVAKYDFAYPLADAVAAREFVASL